MTYTEHYKLAGTQQALEDLGLTKEAGLMWDAARGLYGVVKAPIQGIFGRLGRSALNMGRTAGLSEKTLGTLSNIGQGAASEAAGFGLLGAGLGAATAEPGQRSDAALRGFAGGALGGGAWRMGGNAARMGMGKVLGSNMGKLQQVAGNAATTPWQKRWFGSAKGFGANALTKGVPFAGAMGASMAMPTFEQNPQAQQSQYAQRAMYPLMTG